MPTTIALPNITKKTIEATLKRFDAEPNGGNKINESLSKLFEKINDQNNENEVLIKVAALNHIYSTNIIYIKPVAEKIKSKISNREYSEKEYEHLVDAISTIEWKSPTTGKTTKRINLSFASKYIHFLSNRRTPIYDSYIWIVMIGYLRKINIRITFNQPENYKEFHDKFNEFKRLYNLDKYNNYEIDKFLWLTGKELVQEIMKQNPELTLGQAKAALKRLL